MTCIIALNTSKGIHMVGDLCGNNGHTHSLYPKNSKVFINSDFIIGHTTSYRLGQTLQYDWEPPVQFPDYNRETPAQSSGREDDIYIYKHVAASLKKVLADNSEECGNFLMGWKGRLFEVQPDQSILEHTTHASIGCGGAVAKGALEALLLMDTGLSPKKMLVTTLAIANKVVMGLSLDYTHVYQPNPK